MESGQVDSLSPLTPGAMLRAPPKVMANAPPPPRPGDVTAVTGAGAVQQSKRAREQKEAMRVDGADLASSVQTTGGKTFYLRDGVWTDAEFKAEARLPETKVTFGSEEYFALLKQKPALSQFFSLGERLVVVS